MALVRARTSSPGTVTLVTVPPAGFGAAVAEGGRFLQLTRLRDGRVVAFCETAEGVTGLCTAAEGVTRPSAHGVIGALHDEALLAAEGVRWSSEVPQPRVHGSGVFTFPLGPVRADVAESVGWRLFVMGDEVLGLHLRFGYKRRNLERGMAEAGPGPGVAWAERVTGTSPVAHAVAYCQAWEAALGIAVTPTAAYWRGVLGELERLHSHLGDLAQLASATGLPVAAAELAALRERVLCACADLWGHRYLRGAVVLGGVARAPLADAWQAVADGLLASLAREFRGVVAELDRSPSFLDRLHGAGTIPPAWTEAVRPVGPVGRAADLPYDVRWDAPYGPYRRGAPQRVVRPEADAWARYRVRVGEVLASLAWLRELRGGPPAGGPLVVDPPRDAEPASIAWGRVEGPRGELLYFVGPGWVRTRPASAVNWAVVPPAVAAGNVLQDVPIIEASFGLSVAAMDR